MNQTMSIAIQILIAVESDGDPKKFNKQEQAVGILQIRQVMVDDVNRILGIRNYTLADAWDPGKSINMAAVYFGHYATAERLGHEPKLRDYALLWCAGPNGHKQKMNDSMHKYIARTVEKSLEYVAFVEKEQLALGENTDDKEAKAGVGRRI